MIDGALSGEKGIDIYEKKMSYFYRWCTQITPFLWTALAQDRGDTFYLMDQVKIKSQRTELVLTNMNLP